jgi:hypothetical protein
MQKHVLLEIVKQSQHTNHFSFDRVTEETANLRLNDKTASIGFIEHVPRIVESGGRRLG